MSEVVYVSEVHIDRDGPVRTAKLPGEPQPVRFSIHGAIAEHYGRDVRSLEPHAATLDYIVAATGG
jgi:hypothetical protein